MKHLIILIYLLTAPLIIHAQEHSQEYKVVCDRMEGCPVINGKCPTCIIIKNQNETLDEEITRMIQEMKDKYKKKYQPDLSKRYAKPSGWGIIRWEINEALRVRKDFDF